MVQMSDGDFILPKKASVCDVCHKDPARYRCPRCASRSCSVMCSKKHKEDDNCSGVRDTSSFAPTRRVSDFSGNIIASDEKFLGNVKSSVIERIGAVKPPSSSCLRSLSNQTDYAVDNSWLLRTTESVRDKNQEGKKPLQLDAHMLPDDISTNETECSKEVSATRDRVEGDALSCVHHQLTLAQRYLLSNAHRRRIWLTIIPSDDDGSRHEHYSDTVFWTITLIFRREIAGESTVLNYTYTARNIPESISVKTLIKQFTKPKKIGFVVSRADIDEEKMRVFQEAGAESLLVYMQVPMKEKERYYVIDTNKTILDNLRNRYVVGHPTFILTLDNECNNYSILSEMEARELQEERRERTRRDHPQNGLMKNDNRRNRGFRSCRSYRSDEFRLRGHGGEQQHGIRKRTFNDRRDNVQWSERRSGFQTVGNWKNGHTHRKPHRRYVEQAETDPLQMSPETLVAMDSLRRREPVVYEDTAIAAWSLAVRTEDKSSRKELDEPLLQTKSNVTAEA